MLGGILGYYDIQGGVTFKGILLFSVTVFAGV